MWISNERNVKFNFTGTESEKKHNFSFLIFPGAQGQGHVTWGHKKSA